MFLIPMTRPFLIAAAIIPAIFLLVRVYRADKLEKEPTSLLLRLVGLGIFATLIAMALEELGSLLLDLIGDRLDPTVYFLVFYFLIVAGAEEGAKYYLLKRNTWNAPSFDCQFDGVVYAVFVSLGFALWENISYVTRYGLSTALVRAVTAVPGHACFGVFMGVWYGLAKRAETEGDQEKSLHFRRLAVLIPMVLHGAYDYIATMGDEHLWVFIAFVAALFLTSFFLIKKASREDRPLYGARIDL